MRHRDRIRDLLQPFQYKAFRRSTYRPVFVGLFINGSLQLPKMFEAPIVIKAIGNKSIIYWVPLIYIIRWKRPSSMHRTSFWRKNGYMEDSNLVEHTMVCAINLVIATIFR